MKKIYFISIVTLFFLSSSLHAQSIKNTADTTNNSIDTTIFTKVQTDAQFPGGMEGWVTYLQKNLDSNIPVKKGAPPGRYRVIIRFAISKDGSLSDFQPETNFGYGMEDEFIRVLKKSPRWQPAILLNGQPANAYKLQPVTFVVDGK
jgi:periplasmic protein TonB